MRSRWTRLVDWYHRPLSTSAVAAIAGFCGGTLFGMVFLKVVVLGFGR